MCGIAGIVNLDGRNVDHSQLKIMGDRLSHRGPDGDGYFMDGSVGFVHKRLTIIDLVTGSQPMGGEDGKVILNFNGEIYNFQGLKKELESRGHGFSTSSDTEVLLKSYLEWGVDCLSRLNGMFAFAIYDGRQDRLFCARDRLGVKPFYYYLSSNLFAFASELSSLMTVEDVPRDISYTALDLYLHYQFIPSPLSIYEHVYKLDPAEYILLDLKSGQSVKQKYWSLFSSGASDHDRTPDSWLEELESLLLDAVKIRLNSDVPFGVLLSGGVDSGLITAMMAGELGHPVKTFSIGFEDEDDELNQAAKVVDKYKTDHFEYLVSDDAFQLIPQIAPHFGEPFADSSAIPTFHVSKLAASKVKMVLSGDGGDEIFGGYQRYSDLMRVYSSPSADKLSADMTHWKEKIRFAFGQPAAVPKKIASRIKGMLAGKKQIVRWYDIFDASLRHFDLRERMRLLGREEKLSHTDYFTKQYVHPFKDIDLGTLAQYCEFHSSLPGDILTKVDRMSMANSLEVRSPLLDYRIAEFAFRLPKDMKFPRLSMDGSRNKYIVRKLAVKKYLEPDHVYQPKRGFGIPIQKWLRGKRALDYLNSSVLDLASPMYDLIDKGYAMQVVKDHLKGRENNGYKIWNLLMLDAWARADG